jgi:hypothetical protein
MAVWRRQGLLRQKNHGVLSDVMVCLRVLARTGRLDCMHPRASFPPSSGSTAMYIFRLGRWRNARGIIEWLCTQERWNPGVAIIFCAAARNRRATAGSSHDGAHPALRGAPSSYCSVRAMAVRTCSKFCQLFRVFLGRALYVRGVMHPYFQWASRGKGRH